MAPVNLITVHHEGAGQPAGMAAAQRVSPGGYCCAICTDGFVRFRPASENWATLNFNGQDWTPVFLGDRTKIPITPYELELLNAAFTDAYNRGEVTASALVRAHRNSPGSSTACPGDQTMLVWPKVEAACRPTVIPPEDDVTDLANAMNHDGRPVVFQVGGDKRLYYRVRNTSGGDWGKWTDLSGGKTDFATVTAWANPDSTKIEVWVTMVDGKTFQRYQADDFVNWTGWTDRTL